MRYFEHSVILITAWTNPLPQHKTPFVSKSVLLALIKRRDNKLHNKHLGLFYEDVGGVVAVRMEYT